MTHQKHAILWSCSRSVIQRKAQWRAKPNSRSTNGWGSSIYMHTWTSVSLSRTSLRVKGFCRPQRRDGSLSTQIVDQTLFTRYNAQSSNLMIVSYGVNSLNIKTKAFSWDRFLVAICNIQTDFRTPSPLRWACRRRNTWGLSTPLSILPVTWVACSL